MESNIYLNRLLLLKEAGLSWEASVAIIEVIMDMLDEREGQK